MPSQVIMDKTTGLGIQIAAKRNRYIATRHDIHKGSQFCQELMCLAQFDILIVWVPVQVCGADHKSFFVCQMFKQSKNTIVVALKGVIVIGPSSKIVEGNHLFVTHESPSINFVKDAGCQSPMRIQHHIFAAQDLLGNESSIHFLKTNKVRTSRRIVIQDSSLEFAPLFRRIRDIGMVS